MATRAFSVVNLCWCSHSQHFISGLWDLSESTLGLGSSDAKFLPRVACVPWCVLGRNAEPSPYSAPLKIFRPTDDSTVLSRAATFAKGKLNYWSIPTYVHKKALA